MDRDATISRRNLLRKSLGLQTLEEKHESKDPSQSPAVDCVSAEPALRKDVTPETILKTINSEYVYRLILQRLLAFCCEPKSFREIHKDLMYYPEIYHNRATHTPESLMTWMIEIGAIVGYTEECLEEELWVTTEAGMEAIAVNDPAERLKRLLEEEPAYDEIYRIILKFCLTEHSVDDIEDLLRVHPGLRNPKVYPSHLVERLEFAGALEWTDHEKLITTETGKKPLLNWRPCVVLNW